MSSKKQHFKTTEKAARTAALAAATGAVVCGVGCVLPMALPTIALAGAGSVFAWLGGAYFWVTALAAAMIMRSLPGTYVLTHLEPLEDPVSWYDQNLDRTTDVS
ncbi:hypothetical protein [Nostoc sp. CHAB 5715]|uniref:hypothetical protein n=1 Tax=Nostoc sp. CHAB 5715 TaxID=2780400 RepID=UPI001E2CA188|nr:hypothetical protein [Nostoc sp. CHAB 5715]MCC5625655.1 hypothetical protein [Nostoc sp. CHAB 5715]